MSLCAQQVQYKFENCSVREGLSQSIFNSIDLEIEDSRVGFDKSEDKKGYSIRNLFYRAAQMDGAAELKTPLVKEERAF